MPTTDRIAAQIAMERLILHAAEARRVELEASRLWLQGEMIRQLQFEALRRQP